MYHDAILALAQSAERSNNFDLALALESLASAIRFGRLSQFAKESLVFWTRADFPCPPASGARVAASSSARFAVARANKRPAASVRSATAGACARAPRAVAPEKRMART